MVHAPTQKLLSTLGLMLACMGLAHAQATPPAAAQPATIGSITFLVGEAQLERAGTVSALTKGQALQVGDRLLTGPNGHVHARMVDNGFISVRPSGRLHIQSYTYTPQDPGANRVGLMLEAGVARTISGKAGEAAREHYRFNTPVAAIGLRGTDYVVQALPDATRVSVLKGAVTLSPFGPSCLAGSLAPCTGPLVRELAAGSPHAYMEVRAQGGFPVIILPDPGKNAPNAPNKVAPPRPEEVSAITERQLSNTTAADLLRNSTSAAEAQAKAQAQADADALLQAQARERAQALAQAQAQAEAAAQAQAQADAAAQAAAAQAQADAEAAQAKEQALVKAQAELAAAAAQAKAAAEAKALAEAAAVAEASAQAAAEAAALAKAQADAAAALANAKPPVVVDPPVAPRAQMVWGRWSSVALAGTPTITSVSAPDREITYSNDLFGLLRPTNSVRFPTDGVISMNYLQGEAYLQTKPPGAAQQLTPAALSAASLQLDFNTRQFATSLNATATGSTYELHAQGSIHAQGLLLVDASRSNMNLAGALSNNAQEAGYLFDVKVAPNQNLVGVTRWGR